MQNCNYESTSSKELENQITSGNFRCRHRRRRRTEISVRNGI